jgi:hypothetical protein
LLTTYTCTIVSSIIMDMAIQVHTCRNLYCYYPTILYYLPVLEKYIVPTTITKASIGIIGYTDIIILHEQWENIRYGQPHNVIPTPVHTMYTYTQYTYTNTHNTMTQYTNTHT